MRTSLEIGQKILLVYKSKREGHIENLVFECEIDSILIKKDRITYTALPLHCKNKKFNVGKIGRQLWFDEKNINSGVRGSCILNPVFTDDKMCIKWIKGGDI